MLDSENKIGDIENSIIGKIEQTNIKNQENNINSPTFFYHILYTTQ